MTQPPWKNWPARAYGDVSTSLIVFFIGDAVKNQGVRTVDTDGDS